MAIKSHKKIWYPLLLAACGLSIPVFSYAQLAAAEITYLETLYQQLHQEPELSFEEEQTSKKMAYELRSIGFQVTENVGQWGVVGVFENGAGPTLLIRADMDALPVKENTGLPYASTRFAQTKGGDRVGVMHACGHDLHMTVWTGTARQLVSQKEQWTGTLLFVAQPAEEVGKGARAMLADGLFERFPLPDFGLALHANHFLRAGSIGYTKGYSLANVDMVDITIFGEGGHGAAPHQTIDPVVLSAKIVLALQTIVSRELSPMEPAVLTIGAINGGSKGNVIPSEVSLALTLRSYDANIRQQMIEKIQRICKYEALASGVSASRLPKVVVRDERATAVFNDEHITESALVGIRAAIGDSNVIRVPAVMIGEDFSEYGQTTAAVPLFLFWLGTISEKRLEHHQNTKTPLPTLHSDAYFPDLHPTIATGVMALSAAALQLLQNK